jgi:formate hydrogenlyase subunit 3/multisubunit Na+/H+ antiporter MnhD subunit
VGGSDVLLIIGLGILYQFTQQTNLFSINVILGNPLSYIAFFFLLLAAFAKAGAFPMHTWVPDFAKDAPIESVAFLPAAMDKLLGIYLVARIMMDIFRVPFFINGIVMILGALTVITAVMMALVQHNGRKLLGYHAVSQVGYMVLGIGTGTPIGIIGGIFHMLNNAIYKSNLFLSFGSVEKRTGTAELDEMGGLARVMPFTFVSALIGALSISGIPPFNGFFSKWMVYQGVLETSSSAGAGWQVVTNICLVLAVFGSALTLASFMKFLHSIFLSKMPEKFKGIKEISFNNWFATILLSTLCVVFGLFVFAVPIRFILPILGPEVTIDSILWSFYQPGPVVLLFAVAILVGIILYLVFRKVRFDEEYIGGMTATEENRITGVEFYNEVKEIAPFKKIYAMAEKKYFDIYDIGTNFSLWFGNIFHKLHTGLLHTYAIWTLIGFVILAIILVSAIW